MATTFDDLVRELKGFNNRREVIKAASKGMRTAVKPARAAIKRKAKETLPAMGKLNIWVSKIGITAQIRLSGRRAGVKLKGGRNSAGGRSDVNAIDRGRVRAPSWGRRRKGDWHTVIVQPGFFTKTAADLPDWREDIDAEVDKALDQIRRG
jgi:hypothetical protein